ncbi:TolC family protein [Algoriphagus sp. CAU 1675]|uniref:TolC family protein n=1 Tax=Algoriphagus sp. CAU 1675 TaxID=3032597 RepID=UPI0023DA3CEE|nr:TolC family protein [Algoriphagus sp. CAU 1675]MDF2158646.1 TolC family protein [Algoriphagus sp. CAU 1675]
MNKIIKKSLAVAFVLVTAWGCKISQPAIKAENTSVPETYNQEKQFGQSEIPVWKEVFTDSNLIALIDTALSHNQELNILLQEISIANNEIQARKGEYLPFVNIQGGGGIDKVGRYTRDGVVEANHEIKEGKEFPEPLSDVMVGAFASWELDVWKKLRNAKKSAVFKYLSTVEGKNFMVTQLVAEIAGSYYELMALDNQLSILEQNIQIQKNALEIVKMQKQAAKVTELAVKRFEAEVAKNQSLIYDIRQQITETENRINFLVGRFPQPIQRNSAAFPDLVPNAIQSGLPSQLLANRPDIRQAELDLEAAKLDVKVAKANFYPQFRLTAGMGFQAFNPRYLLTTPESLIYSVAGDLVAPLVNKNAIKANYRSASAQQIQAVYNYERSILNGYIEVTNQLSKINNLDKSYALKSQQVAALTESISISNNLFKSARADYMEVLLTQRDALESKMELVETKMMQLNALVHVYQALGGGWN